jgi:hypothetical protein
VDAAITIALVPSRHRLRPLLRSSVERGFDVDVLSGKCEVSVVIAFRAAKVIGASIYDVIAGWRCRPTRAPTAARSRASTGGATGLANAPRHDRAKALAIGRDAATTRSY